ncbi:MAG: rane protein [Actinomycetota bacterium]|nr:rane protein [Actinomycetota bacterium]
MTTARARLGKVVDRIRATRALRALTRYSTTRGGVLAAGIAYYALFSIVPLLIVAFTVLGLVAGQDRQAQSEIADWVNRGLGETLIGTAPGQGVVRLDDLTRSELLSLTGSIGLFTLLLTSLGWVGATRQGLRAVFGLPVRRNPVKARLRDLGTSVLLGGAVLTSGLVGIAVPTATDAVLDRLGLEHTAWTSAAVRITTLLLVWAIDAGIALILLRLLSGVRVPVNDLIGGAVTAGLGLGVLKLGGGLLLGGLSQDVYLATSSVLIGLLVWADLTARLLLLCAAWSATTAEDRGHLPPLTQECPEPSLPVPCPECSPRAKDTVTVAAGAVLGATAVTAAWVVTRAAGQIRSALRD